MLFFNRIQVLFALALVIGMAGIVIGMFSRIPYTFPTVISIIVPLFVLLLYVFLGNQIKGKQITTEQFGDSAYFLGFMFTLGALMVSITKLAFDDKTEISSLLVCFAVALSTTMVGLMARLWIVNLSGAYGNEGEKAFRNLTEQSNRYRKELENLTTGLIAQGYRVHESVEHVTEDMALKAKQAMKEASETMTTSVSQASLTITEKTDELFLDIENGLTKIFIRMDQSFTELENNIFEQSKNLKNAFETYIHQISTAETPDNLFIRRLDPPLENLDKTLHEISLSIDKISKTMVSVEQVTVEIDTLMGSVGSAMDNIRINCEGAAGQLGEIQNLGKALDHVQQRLAGLKLGFDRLNEQLDQYTKLQGKMTNAHDNHVQAVYDHTQKMRNALSDADDMVIKVGQEMIAAANFVRQHMENH